ncbi:hypothetical protein [Desulfitobacterium sp.]|uniref:hypothetical protein n=1 Tax=Desulfitobacterium sp. TaxID=49981 RepID=UPI002C69359E|nr:hypothetical protein [Desulfitobacterium sp.]HVJ47997.1 hypothetical protein [Desulfitobacterium sp.]
MREIWPIFGVVLTGTLWGISGLWEWTVPERLEQRILEWKRKWYWSQVIIRVISDVPIEELEQFAWSIKSTIPKLQRELGIPVVLEIEWKAPELLIDPAECCLTNASKRVQDQNSPEFKVARQNLDEYSDEKKSDLNFEKNEIDPKSYFSCLSRRFPEFFWMGQVECE